MKLISFISLTLLSFSSAKTINDEDIAIGVLFPEDDSHCKSGESKRLQNALTNAFEQVEPYIGRRNLREGRNLSAWYCPYYCANIAPGQCWLVYPVCRGYRRQLKNDELEKEMKKEKEVEKELKKTKVENNILTYGFEEIKNGDKKLMKKCEKAVVALELAIQQEFAYGGYSSDCAKMLTTTAEYHCLVVPEEGAPPSE